MGKKHGQAARAAAAAAAAPVAAEDAVAADAMATDAAAAGPSGAPADQHTSHTSADYYFDSYAHFGASLAAAAGFIAATHCCSQRPRDSQVFTRRC